jgi:hypothetical protein
MTAATVLCDVRRTKKRVIHSKHDLALTVSALSNKWCQGFESSGQPHDFPFPLKQKKKNSNTATT